MFYFAYSLTKQIEFFLFFFCLIILAFSLNKTMAANYKTISCLPSPKGSVAATQHPIKKFVNRAQGNS